MSSMPHCLRHPSAQPQRQTSIHAKRRRLSLSPVCHAASAAPKQGSLRQLAEAHRPKKVVVAFDCTFCNATQPSSSVALSSCLQAPSAGPARKQQSAGQHKKGAPDAQRLSKVMLQLLPGVVQAKTVPDCDPVCSLAGAGNSRSGLTAWR